MFVKTFLGPDIKIVYLKVSTLGFHVGHFPETICLITSIIKYLNGGTYSISDYLNLHEKTLALDWIGSDNDCD